MDARATVEGEEELELCGSTVPPCWVAANSFGLHSVLFSLSTWAHFVLKADRLSQQFLTSRALDLHRLRRVCVEVVAGPSLVGPCVAGGMIEIPSVYFDFVVKYQ